MKLHVRPRARRVAASLALLLAAPASVRAAGFEFAPIGARDGGRAGASVAGADSALGLFYNPATLLAGPGAVDAALALHAHVGELCFAGVEVAEAADGTRSAGASQPRVCSAGSANLLPEFASTMRFGSRHRFALALGVSVPLARDRRPSFGDVATGTIGSGADTRPAPTQYLLMDEQLLQVFPSLGVAYEAHPQLRVGASFGWGVTTFDFTQAAYTRVVALPPDLVVANADVAVRTTGIDAFTPRFQLGLVAQPVRSWPLWLALSFTHTSDIQVEDAKVRLRSLRTAYESSSPLFTSGLAGTPAPSIAASVANVRVNIPQTSNLTGGLRYARLLATPADGVGDRLSKERFDVELDAVYTWSGRVDHMTASLPPTTLRIPSPNALVSDVNLQLPTRFDLPQRWRDQVTLRLGGDYNVLPGRLALRAGVQYESSGIRHGYEQLLYAPAQNWGLALGATVRILAQLDASLAYTHFFVRTQHVAPGSAQLRRQVAGDARPEDAVLVNAGTFTQRLDAVVGELTARF